MLVHTWNMLVAYMTDSELSQNFMKKDITFVMMHWMRKHQREIEMSLNNKKSC